MTLECMYDVAWTPSQHHRVANNPLGLSLFFHNSAMKPFEEPMKEHWLLHHRDLAVMVCVQRGSAFTLFQALLDKNKWICDMLRLAPHTPLEMSSSARHVAGKCWGDLAWIRAEWNPT